MLTALLGDKKIVATDKQWEHRKNDLRSLCNNKAVCPLCKEPIICKFGNERIHHFAHSHKANCPGHNETLEHMLGKDLLYGLFKDLYANKAHVELEYFITKLNTTCDVLIQFQDGKTWVIEFYCGHEKDALLKDKLAYYKQNNIRVFWISSIKRFSELDTEPFIKLKKAERLMATDTGIDKFYSSDWYTKIVTQRIPVALPVDMQTLGTLYFINVNDKTIKIVRALRETGHTGVFNPGAIIQGLLTNIKVSAKGNALYFEEEKVWYERYKIAESVLKEIDEEQRIERERCLLMLRDRPKVLPTYQTSYENRQSLRINNSLHIRSDNTVYTCERCGSQYAECDMVVYQKLNKIGICRDCLK